MTTTDRSRRGRRPSPVKLELLAKRAELEQRTKQEIKAADFRLRGWGYQRIADALEIEYAEARDMVQGLLRRDWEADADKLDELRQLEIARLDRLWDIYFPRATQEGDDVRPDMAAANFCMKIAKRRAELLGLDREQKIAQTVNVNLGDAAIRQMVEASGDPESLAALERVAAIFAHGEAALDAEYEEIPDPEDGE